MYKHHPHPFLRSVSRAPKWRNGAISQTFLGAQTKSITCALSHRVRRCLMVAKAFLYWPQRLGKTWIPTRTQYKITEALTPIHFCTGLTDAIKSDLDQKMTATFTPVHLGMKNKRLSKSLVGLRPQYKNYRDILSYRKGASAGSDSPQKMYGIP